MLENDNKLTINYLCPNIIMIQHIPLFSLWAKIIVFQSKLQNNKVMMINTIKKFYIHRKKFLII